MFFYALDCYGVPHVIPKGMEMIWDSYLKTVAHQNKNTPLPPGIEKLGRDTTIYFGDWYEKSS